jgi:type IV pilus assembly protein PilO
VPVALNIAGKFHQLTKFFYNVSRLERAINMENISLTQPTKDGEEIIMNVSVLATTFRRPDGAAPGAAK